MKTWTTLLVLVLFSRKLAGQGYKPASGYVPDSKTAIRIAEAVLVPVYGDKHIESERPFTATLKDGAWIVTGTLPCQDSDGGTKSPAESKTKALHTCFGGVAEVRISKDDARILYMMHGK